MNSIVLPKIYVCMVSNVLYVISLVAFLMLGIRLCYVLYRYLQSGVMGSFKLKNYIWVLIILFIINSFSIRDVRGSSMYPCLGDGDSFLSTDFVYNVDRGDIVIADVQGTSVVKRVYGLPGDVIRIKKSCILINEKPVLYGEFQGYKKSLYHLENGEYFLLGDNLSISNDSRYFGTVNRSEISAKLVAYLK